MGKTLFDPRLCDREFGANLCRTSQLVECLGGAATALAAEGDVDLSDYEFVQVEAVLAAIQRWGGRFPASDAASVIRTDTTLSQHRMAEGAPDWLLGGEAYRKWSNIIRSAVADDEIELLDHQTYKPAIDVEDVDTDSESAHKPDESGDAELAALFDPVSPKALEAMFPADEQWEAWARRASRNGLIEARAKQGLFNPFLAAQWWLNTGRTGKGGKWERCVRVLATNLPRRSLDKKHLLTGDFD